MTDYYVTNPEKLNGQPKRSIADYVESCGFLVPRRFIRLAEARRSGLPIICRSEHRDEYDGPSGLLLSPALNEFPATGDIDELKRLVLQRVIAEMHIEEYCALIGSDAKRFRDEISFSFWEMMGGHNRTVVADSSIPNRHHVMTYLAKDHIELFNNYAVVEDGTVLQSFGSTLTEELVQDVPRLIQTYENIRHLPRFDPNHCPIMEFQTLGKKDYFLQYHRTRDFQPATFRLVDIPLEDRGIQALFVRGATSPEGIVCKTAAYYVNNPADTARERGLPEEDASFDKPPHDIFSEVMVRRRKAQMIDSHSLEQTASNFVCGHNPRSKLFKPGLSVIVNMITRLEGRSLLSVDDWKRIVKNARDSGEDQYLNIRVISDGREASVKVE
jgi:hypothetical protein